MELAKNTSILTTKMKKILHKNKKLFLIFLTTLIALACVSRAWATLSFVKTKDASSIEKFTSGETIPSHFPLQSKSHAPEPSTMALFATGFLGMILNFVRRAYSVIKRIIDITFSIIGIILSCPLLLVAAILIKLTSKGPILFTQVRVGKDGKNFEIYKLRTMRIDAEKETGPVWAAKNDSRLIPVGKFLRKSRIDEIPQFINVLKGDMSIIGPRPERPVFVERFVKEIPDYEKRLLVKPGITGLAQVWHKYDETLEDVKKKIRYDLLYIRKLSLWTDFKIALNTFRVVLTGHGAR